MSMNTRPAMRGKPKVRPPRKIGPDTSMKDTWTKLSYAIKEIQNHNVSKLSYEEHYRYAYNMVLFKLRRLSTDELFELRQQEGVIANPSDGDQLYNGVRQLVIEHLDHLAETLIVPAFPRSGGTAGLGRAGGGAEAVERALEGDRFLKSLKGVWEDHTGSMRKVKDVLRYMDKVYTQAHHVPIIYEVGLHLFLLTIIRSPKYPIHTHLIGSLLSQVQLERDGETITRTTVRDCVDILLRLQDPALPSIGTSAVDLARTSVYSTDFEPEFLRRSGEFYEMEAGEMLEGGDAANYLRNVEKRLAQESDRTAHYLSHLTQPALLALVVSKLLTPHLHSILHMPGTGIRPMLEADRVGDLRRLYTLFTRVPNDVGRQALRQALKADVEERGKAINEGGSMGAGSSTGAGEEEGDDEEMEGKGKGKATGKGKAFGGAAAVAVALRWVQDVLDLKDKFDRILEDAFGGDKTVQTSINEAFQSFINANTRAPEYLSLFIDEHLKKGTKSKSEDEIEIALEKTIILFRFLSDKDRFERHYKTHLAKRLLYARSASDDSERGMVAKLKVEMGFQFTQKLEGMFNDMRLSAEGANTFRNYLNRHGTLPLELQVSVLTTSNWPPGIIASSPLSFPAPLSEATGVFQTYYDSRHSGRRLTWQGNLGTADVRVRFRARSHDVNCSTQALVVLLAFEEIGGEEAIGYEQLKSLTSIPEADLTRTLQSLACGKYRLLLKSPKGREVSPTDTFTFNEAFTCPLARIKILQVAAARVETGKEREETEGMVEEERRFQVEACIVRIMKNRKAMGHNDLISDVAHQLSSRFIPSTTMIKQRIEGLIDREYLERGEDIGTYKYLA